MRRVMWSWTKFIVGICVDDDYFADWDAKYELAPPWKKRKIVIIHLGFLTLILPL